ncbi:Uma2 family endonuclease [Lusitaniella coriacea LEGE 07157]|uniref:Uma2 family endonuclease n=1 Tax=Lusitaniella coriacea LEGE 07157 TaxID=945747 RepID=A0A8J7DXZ1_9CYAN|nr:Uma2 family endonuclease [Lusitaniella coriacea]MBE9117125.1 Uma2 family endonuclease [Lusitaniella coriacea LEGE 07157]
MVSTTPKYLQIPPLENGDRLTRYEFERRYNAMPHLKKAELIEGIVHMASPLRFEPHAEPHARIITGLGVYQALTPGVRLGDNPTVRLDLDNEPQPDVVLLIDPASGGQSQLSKDGYIEGAPELVVEIAASSAAIDLHAKKRAYRRNGIKEYIVWQVLDERLSWFYLEKGEYLDLPVDEDGILRSRVFPGLWLAVSELLGGKMQQVLAVLQQGLSSAEHKGFVQDLAKVRDVQSE